MKEWDFEEVTPKLWEKLGITVENLRKADAKRTPTEEIDFTEQIANRIFKNYIKELQTKADEKAGYPPKCNPGYEASPDKKKCIPIKKDEAGWKKKKTK